MMHGLEDKWSTKEKLALFSAVSSIGKDWESVGKALKSYLDGNQPLDWSTPENCAIQYEAIISSLITPRKTFRISSVDADQTIIKRLRQERINELSSTAERSKNAYLKLKGQIEAIQDGLQNHRLQEIWSEILREKELQREKDEAKTKILDEREQQIEEKLLATGKEGIKEGDIESVDAVKEKKEGEQQEVVQDDIVECVTEVVDIPDSEYEISVEGSDFPVPDEGSVTHLEMPPELTAEEVEKTLGESELIEFITDDIIVEDNELPISEGPEEIELNSIPQNFEEISEDQKFKITPSSLIKESPILYTEETQNYPHEATVDMTCKETNTEVIGKTPSRKSKAKKEKTVKVKRDAALGEENEIISKNIDAPDPAQFSVSMKGVDVSPTGDIEKDTLSVVVKEPIDAQVGGKSLEEVRIMDGKATELVDDVESSMETDQTTEIVFGIEEEKLAAQSAEVISTESPPPVQSPEQLPDAKATEQLSRIELSVDEEQKVKTERKAEVLESVPSEEEIPVRTPGEEVRDERDLKVWRKSILLVWKELCLHKNSSVFMKPISDEKVKSYSLAVKRPMDLATIKKNIDTGVITTTTEFYRDVILMFCNATIFNSNRSDIYEMAMEMQKSSIEIIQNYIHTQLILQADGAKSPSPEKEEPFILSQPTSSKKGKKVTSSTPLSTPDFKRRRTRNSENF